MDPRKVTDMTFGIRYESGIPMIGNKEIKIDGYDIIVDGSRYHGTSGLWSLVTEGDPDGYESDYCWYTDLLYQTNALYQGYDRHTSYPRASRLKKWTNILRPIWNEIQLTDLNSEYTDDSGDNDKYYDPTPWKVESEKTEYRLYFDLCIEFLYIIVNIVCRIVIYIERINEKINMISSQDEWVRLCPSC